MSETQLREAYTLMKQGNKHEAARLIQNVLKEDRSNQQAWWLFSHVLEDEDRIVKSLEKVLTLNPAHPGARKRLAELRPEYAHLAENPTAGKEKPKANGVDAKYWQKLDNEAKTREKNEANQLVKQALFSGFGIRLVMFLVLALFGTAFAIYFKFNNEQNYYDKNGDTPLTIGTRFLEAMYREHFDTLYALSCPEYYPQIEEMVDDDSEFLPSEITVDMSQTELSIFYQNGNLAFVKIEGVTVIQYPARYFRIDWDEDAEFEGIDIYGQHFRKSEEGVWQVCVEFDVPNLEMLDG